MYAIVEVQGDQVKVEKDKQVIVPFLKEEIGTSLTLDKVLLLSGDSGVKVGKPYVKDATVIASVVGHDRDKKVIVFKKKRRKGYKVKKGHREPFTILKIDEIKSTKTGKSKTTKSETVEKTAEVSEEKTE